LNKKNNIASRKKSSLCSNSSKLSKELFEIENTSLNELTSRNISFRINVVKIVQEKRVRKSSKDFANTTWINEKITRIFVFYTTMMIVFNTKTSKLEIKTISSFHFTSAICRNRLCTEELCCDIRILKNFWKLRK
jgi:hypothetical protein